LGINAWRKGEFGAGCHYYHTNASCFQVITLDTAHETLTKTRKIRANIIEQQAGFFAGLFGESQLSTGAPAAACYRIAGAAEAKCWFPARRAAR
jgi:hypothetical protein